MNLDQCKKLYYNTFKDDDTVFGEQLFYNCWEYCRYTFIGNKPISMLFSLPCKLFYNDKQLDSYYVYAAATDPDYRNKGYMASLISSLFKEDKFIFLKPENDSLIRYYSKLGFTVYKSSINKGNYYVEPQGNFKLLLSDVLMTNKEYTGMYYYKQQLNLNNIYFPYTME